MRNFHFPHPHRRKERGAIALEFAVSFPIVISVFMVMMFLMDLMMVKQEVTSIGNSAMRECVKILDASPAALGDCVMDIVRQTQTLAGSNHRYTCQPGPGVFQTSDGITMQVINLECRYEGFAPMRSILDLTLIDMNDLVNLNVPVFFPK